MEKKHKILVTGGASGIGLGLTERFLQEGHTVIVCGRREQVLKELTDKFPSVIAKQCDLESAAEREALYNWISKQHPDLNILVNNAGIQNWMSIDDKDFYRKAEQEIAINIEAPVHLANLFINLPSLHTIMNVTSGLSFSPFAKVPVYSATKAFLRSFTQSLRYLLRPRNIDVIEIIPPALNTDLGGQGLHTYAPPVSDFIESIFEQMKQGKKELTFGTSTDRLNASAEELKGYFEKLNP
jgi:uncharacterized oxidoreductase